MIQKKEIDSKLVGNIAVLIFCTAYFLFSFTKYGVRLGSFKIIFSDLLILLSFVFAFFLKWNHFRSEKIKIFVLICASLFTVVLLSAINAVNYFYFLNGLLPWIFSLILIYSFIKIYPQNIRFFEKILKRYITLAIIIQCIPAYYSLFISRLVYFFDPLRYEGFTMNSNQLISYILISLFIYGAMEYRDKGKAWRTLLLALISIIPIMLSGSRTGLIIGAAVIFILFVLNSVSLSVPKKLAFALIIIISIPAISNQFNVLQSGNYSVRRALLIFDFISGEEEVDGSTKTRQSQSEFGINLFKQHPVVGIGMDNFRHYYLKRFGLHQEVHNSFISYLYETGMLGFIFFISFWILLLLLIVLSRKINRKTKIYLLTAVLMFMAMNTFHIYFRERWVWFFFIFILMFTSNFRLKQIHQ